MRVLEVADGAAACVDDQGVPHEGVSVDLVGPVAAGDRLLVHAGVAIGTL